MVSDDTEHAVMTVLALQGCELDADTFARHLARRLRWWLAGAPAGIGFATLRSILKLWCGVSPAHSGVWSAGNGPMMRAAVIGVNFADSPETRRTFVDASTRITHSDPRASEAARMIAEAASLAARQASDSHGILEGLEPLVESPEMKKRFSLLREALAQGASVQNFADSFGRKKGFVSGFAPDSCAVALFAWLRHRGDFRATLESVVAAGGDADTVAFIAGSLAGIDAGPEAMPSEWLAGLRDRPISRLTLQDPSRLKSLRYPSWPLSIIRNFCFFGIVLCHLVRRALPPY